MKEFLKKIKLIDILTLELDSTKSEFISRFKPHVDEGDIGIFSSFFEVFSSSKNEYKGTVGYDGFKIRKRKKFFDTNKQLTIITGKYRQNHDKLIIEAEVNGFPPIIMLFYLFLVVFFIIFISIMLSFKGSESMNKAIMIPMFLLYMLAMLGLPYIFMRRSVKKTMHSFERELFYIANK